MVDFKVGNLIGSSWGLWVTTSARLPARFMDYGTQPRCGDDDANARRQHAAHISPDTVIASEVRSGRCWT